MDDSIGKLAEWEFYNEYTVDNWANLTAVLGKQLKLSFFKIPQLQRGLAFLPKHGFCVEPQVILA